MAAKKERPAPAKAPKASSTMSKPRTEARSKNAPKTDLSLGNDARIQITQDELRKLVSEAAYYRAKQRGFTPGHEEDDWIQAEAEVLRRIGADGTPRR
jgi:hypothetical protein